MKGYCKLTFLVFLVLLNKLTFLKYRVPLFMTGYINLPLSSVFPSTVHDRLYKPTWGSRFPSTWQIKLTYMRFRVPLYMTGYINLSEVLGSPLHDRLYKPTWGSGFPSTWQVQVILTNLRFRVPFYMTGYITYLRFWVPLYMTGEESFLLVLSTCRTCAWHLGSGLV